MDAEIDITGVVLKTDRLVLRPFCMDDLDDFYEYAKVHMPGYGYGLGVRTMIDPVKGGSNGSVGDFGWGGAAGAYLAVDLPNNFTMYYAQHVVNSPNHKKCALVYASVLEELTGISISRASSYREDVGKTTY